MGEDCVNRIRNSRVVICGLGGVGGFALEALARLGVENFFLIDDDKFELSNLNRQVLAEFGNIGLLKVDVALERLKSISGSCALASRKKAQEVIFEIENFKPDIVVDAIDDLDAKALLIKQFYNKAYVVVSAGAGNRIDPTLVTYADLSKTSNCSLARALRKRLKSFDIVSGVDVVFSKEVPKKEFNNTQSIGSAVFVPMAFGSIISYLCCKYICNKL
ncbi:ThiF family adenylyltransferase [Thermodesulfobium sp. 4217-1]|uniref:tRNA threonylcarbamoyladenosine dehydratase n=1 Tax=Thermodesulfobium sp. 4217-1 TaxID=3120013 RepID=UPI00322188B9